LSTATFPILKKMIKILHGDNFAALRGELFKIKSQSEEVISLDCRKLDLTNLIQAFEANSLFFNKKLVVLENANTLNLKTDSTRQIVDYLAHSKSLNTAVICSDKVLSPAFLNKLKGAEISLFKHPVIIFKFVESLYPENTASSLSFLREALKNSEIELVFAMVVRQFRLLLAIRYNALVEDVKRLASWQKGKLKHQADFFSEKSLLKSYKELMIIDYQIKTGKSVLNLTKRLELFIINL